MHWRLNMLSIKTVSFSTIALLGIIFTVSETALAACQATVNGRPMTHQECALAIRTYGRVIPGNYLVDQQGNWVNINNPRHRGNTYIDARNNYNRRHNNYGGSWGGGSAFSPRGVYDGSGGCEGGSCVNIID